LKPTSKPYYGSREPTLIALMLFNFGNFGNSGDFGNLHIRVITGKVF
jgi:hypothetical protein